MWSGLQYCLTTFLRTQEWQMIITRDVQINHFLEQVWVLSDDQWWFFSMFYQWTVLKERFCDTLAEQILKFALPLSSFTVKLVLYRQNGDQKLRLQRAKYSPGSRSKHKWRRLSAEYYCRYQQNSMTQVYFVSLKYFFNGSIGLVSPNINPHQR